MLTCTNERRHKMHSPWNIEVLLIRNQISGNDVLRSYREKILLMN